MTGSSQQEQPVEATVRADSPAWHTMSAADVLAAQSSTEAGLNDSQVAERLGLVGPNRLPPPEKRSLAARFFIHFHDVLIYVLLAAAALTAVLGEWLDTSVIIGVVLINAIIGFIQEGKAEEALEAIRKMLATKATVIRMGSRLSIAGEELVPGDMVLLEAGERVPADVRLVTAKNLRVEEAILTGESVPVEKHIDPVEQNVPLGDRKSMAFSGTLVTSGHGTGVVVETGPRTSIGQISGMLHEVTTLATPLTRQMGVFAQWLTAFILGMAALVLVFGLLVRDYSFTDIFMAVVGLTVAAIPEGLPAILTITLAIGVQAMARSNAIVRRLPAIETLGSVSVICSDKTGTLTRNEMTVTSIVTTQHLFSISGVGYAPVGEFILDGTPIEASGYPLLTELTTAAALCNDAGLREVEGQWVIDGDPMEGALVTLAGKAGLAAGELLKRHPRTDVIPFDSDHGFMATLHHDHSGNGFCFVKGAPERILEMCGGQRGIDPDEKLDADYWLAQMEKVAAKGQRVLAIAVKPYDSSQTVLNFSDVESGLTMLGLCGFIDPPREEAIAAVAECQAAGIQVKMVTGDHAGTASAIARELGLKNHTAVLTGQDIDGLDDSSLRDRVKEASVFARTSPNHKLRLVMVLQDEGAVVAMTGDGVNDAPALKRADVGIAMGQNGSEAAKEAAEMVLADDNFATIAQSVSAGRTVYDNLKKSILFILPTNGAEAAIVMLAILLGTTLPVTALQILWVNMVTAVTLALALAFEPTEPGVMKRPPRKPGESILSGLLIWKVVFVSSLFVLVLMGAFQYSVRQGLSIEESRTIVVNMLVVLEIVYLFSVRYLQSTSFTLRGVVGTPAVLIAVATVTLLQFLFTYAPFMTVIFDARPLSFVEGTLIVASGALVFVILELEKWVYARFTARGSAASGKSINRPPAR